MGDEEAGLEGAGFFCALKGICSSCAVFRLPGVSVGLQGGPASCWPA